MGIDEKPLVTIALFAYNQELYVREAVDSALEQDYPNLQILVSDDRSTDGTFAVMQDCVAKYSGPHKVVVRQNQKNLGMAGHINALLALAQGDFICWMAGDDVALPNKVSRLVAPMIADSSLCGTHSFVQEIDSAGRVLGMRRPNVPAIIDSPYQVVTNEVEVISQSHAFRKAAWDCFGPLEESVTNESAVMAFREASIGRILLIPEALTNYRVGVGTSTRRGQTVEDLAVSEPVKYAKWWSSGFSQIARDARHVGASERLLGEVDRKLAFFNARRDVNEHPWAFSVLFKNIFTKGFPQLAKAFARRNMPRLVLSYVYKRKGWLT